MEKKLVISALFLFFALSACLFGQVPPAKTDPWTCVRSDDGEFSIEIPSQCTFYSNKRGFTIGRINTSEQYDLKNAAILNCLANGSLLSFEVFESNSHASTAEYDNDMHGLKTAVETEVRKQNYTIRQAAVSNDKYYFVRQHFFSKKHIYILSAGSRTGETAEIRRFLDSLIFTPNIDQAAGQNVPSFSSLRSIEPMIEMSLEEKEKGKEGPGRNKPDLKAPLSTPTSPAAESDGSKKLVILRKPVPAYTYSARMYDVKGAISLKLTFSQYGNVSHIRVLKVLPEGLLRQVLFASLRIKFLPPEKEGKAEMVEKSFIYNFNIYTH